MLVSIGILLLCGLLLGELCKKIHLPSLFGMVIAGIIIGPYVFNLLDKNLMNISSDIRRIALMIILIRAGLKLDINDLKKVGRSALLMCFVPATVEIIGMVLLAPLFFQMSYLDAAILGAVIAAVSPAVVVPRMIQLIDKEYGTKQGIPQMILAGASVDDVYVIVLFTTFTSLAKGEGISIMRFINIPLSILIGIIIGMIAGVLLSVLFSYLKLPKTMQVLLIFIISFFFHGIEENLGFPFASLIAIMVMCMEIRIKNKKRAITLSKLFDQLWIPAEIFLFVLVGASVKITSLTTAGIGAVLLLLCVIVFRMIGVYLCLIGTSLTSKEKLFTMMAYTPKATVQAAIGSIPLSMGLSCGETVLTVSVIAILLTAPLGALLIDNSYQRLLSQ